MTLLGRLKDARFPFQGIGINGGLELAEEASPERIVTCHECGNKMPEHKAFKTRHGYYVCKGPCLSEHLEADAKYEE